MFTAAKSQCGIRPFHFLWQDSKGDDELVSWEVWAALSELIVCRSTPAFAPPVTAAWVWQRAEEIRRAEKTINADSTVDDTSKTGFPGSHSEGDLGIRSAAGFEAFDSGHGDISFWADEECSREQRPPEECFKAAERTGRSRASQKSLDHQTAPSSMLVRRRPNSAPQTSIASKGRLHQTLTKSQRSWSLRSKSQCKLRRDQGQGQGQGQTRGYNRALTRSCSSPSHRNGAMSSTTTLLSQSGKSPHSRRLAEREGAEGPIPTPTLRRRPMTAPVDQSPTRAGTKGPAHPTTSARPISGRQGYRQVVHESARMRGEGSGLQPEIAKSPGFASQTLGWRGGGATAHGGGSEFEWRGEEAAHDDMENGHLRTETASAKRKAAQYQTCMLEAQVCTEKTR